MRLLVLLATIAVVGTGCSTSDPADNATPSRPLIAFDDSTAIYTMHEDGGNVQRLIEGTEPDFAADGSKIVYSTGHSIDVINPDGTDHAVVADGYGYQPAFSPDGKSIAFARTGVIHVVDADGANLRALTAPLDPLAPPGPGQDSSQSPSFAPDGSRILFTRGAAIWVMNSDGTAARQLLADPFYNSDPVSAPDGKIVFASNRGGRNQSELYIMDETTRNIQQLTDAYAVGPDLSADGTRIFFTQISEAQRSSQIWVMDSQGPRRISDEARTAQHPTWALVH